MSALPTCGSTDDAADVMARAEDIVAEAEQRARAWAYRLAASAIEEAEDIWAEAQAMRHDMAANTG